MENAGTRIIISKLPRGIWDQISQEHQSEKVGWGRESLDFDNCFFRMWCTNLQLLMGFWSLKLAWEAFIWKQLKFSVIQVLGGGPWRHRIVRFHHLTGSLWSCASVTGEPKRFGSSMRALKSCLQQRSSMILGFLEQRLTGKVLWWPLETVGFPRKGPYNRIFFNSSQVEKVNRSKITCCNWAVLPVESIATHF